MCVKLLVPYYGRYLSRAVLVPFVYDPPDVIPDVLHDLLNNAHAAIPSALKVGQRLAKIDKTTIESLSSKIDEMLNEYKKDSRLTTQYAVSILCAQEVLNTVNIMFVKKYI